MLLGLPGVFLGGIVVARVEGILRLRRRLMLVELLATRWFVVLWLSYSLGRLVSLVVLGASQVAQSVIFALDIVIISRVQG